VLSNRWFRFFSVILVLVLVFLTGTPFLIRHYAAQWLREHGGQQVQFRDVDFNPFTATLLLKGLNVAVDRKTTLSFETAGAELAWLPLLRKQVEVQAVHLEGFHIIVDKRQKDRLLIGGIQLPVDGSDAEQGQAAGNAWTAGIKNVTFSDIHVHYLDNRLDLQLDLDHLTLGSLYQWSAESPAQLDASGSLNKAPFRLSGELAPLAKRPHYAVTLDLKSLPLDSFATLLQDQVQRLSGQLSYQGTLAYRQDSDGYSIHQEGSTRVQLLDAAVRQPPINAHNDDARLDSKLSFSSAAGEPTLQLSSDIRLSGLNVVAGDSRLELLRSARLDLSGLAMQGMDRLSIQSVAAEKLVIGRQADDTEQDASMDVDRFEVTSLALADKLLSVDEVNYTGGHNHLRRDPEGNWRIIAIVKAMSRLAAKQEHAEVAPAPREGTDNTAEAPQPLAAVVKRIKVDGDSTISLLDQSVKPAFQVNVKLNSVLIESLDTRQPEQKSPVQIDASVGKYTRLSLQGDVQPFATPLGMDLKANIDALDLPPLSPYTRESLGLVLDSGTLDADATVKIDKKKMDGLVKLKLHQLELENVESKNSLQSQIPVPLDVALDTLRDSNNTISLKVPVTGDPANPDFDVNDVLSKALAGGVKKGALTYLTLALQPYGTLITAAKYAGEEITKVRLNPVEFEPGQAGLNDTDKDYLSKVAKVLNERPQLAIKLCGVAVPRDTAWFRQQAAAAQKSGDKTGTATRPAAPEVADTQLLDLARARAESVKDYLVTTFKIPADHLVGCRPRIETDADKGAAPRTDLLI
jgi:hypothetical protein